MISTYQGDETKVKTKEEGKENPVSVLDYN
jgi:hypothetical protein